MTPLWLMGEAILPGVKVGGTFKSGTRKLRGVAEELRDALTASSYVYDCHPKPVLDTNNISWASVKTLSLSWTSTLSSLNVTLPRMARMGRINQALALMNRRVGLQKSFVRQGAFFLCSGSLSLSLLFCS